jgi:hypothetical protein
MRQFIPTLQRVLDVATGTDFAAETAFELTQVQHTTARRELLPSKRTTMGFDPTGGRHWQCGGSFNLGGHRRSNGLVTPYGENT